MIISVQGWVWKSDLSYAPGVQWSDATGLDLNTEINLAEIIRKYERANGKCAHLKIKITLD
jgi:hypothetical protein